MFRTDRINTRRVHQKIIKVRINLLHQLLGKWYNKTCSSCPVRYLETLFWDDITKFWDENLLLLTFLTEKLRKKTLFWINKKFVYLNIITNFCPKITSQNNDPTTWKAIMMMFSNSLDLIFIHPIRNIWTQCALHFLVLYLLKCYQAILFGVVEQKCLS